MKIEVSTGERWDGAVRLRRIPTVVITIGGVRYTTDAPDDVTAMRLAAQHARILGVKLGGEP